MASLGWLVAFDVDWLLVFTEWNLVVKYKMIFQVIFYRVDKRLS